MTDKYSDADRVAVEAYRNRKDWKVIHDDWARKTRRSLSPSTFGRHITELHDEIYKPAQPPPPAPQQQPQQQQQQQQQQQPLSAINQTPTPISATHRSPISSFKSVNPEPRSAPHHGAPAQGAPQSSARPPPPTPTSAAPASGRVGVAGQQDHLHNQAVTRAEFQEMQSNVMRLNDTVMRIQEQMQRMAGDLTALYERRSSSQPQFGEDLSTLDRLAETISQMASKVGDIDGMKVQMEMLKSRLKRIEGDQPQLNITAPSPRETSYSAGGPTRMPPPAAPGILNTPISASTATPSTANTDSPAGWNAVNSNKRKLSPIDPARGLSDKRQRADSPAGAAPSERSYQYAPSSVPTLASMPRPPERPVQTSPPGYYSGTATSIESPQQWISESGRQYGVAGRRGPGRPRKTSPELPTPTHWEKDPWASTSPGQEYRPISAAGAGGIDPYSERGRIVRRGSGGGVGQPFYSHTSADNLKKTRQRPIRNSDGVLIRKDGKPDQRSVSSPMNLKKVHARKMEAAAAAAAGPDASEGDMQDGDETGEYDSPMSPSSPASQDDGNTERPTPVPAPNDGDEQQNHKQVMEHMFPNGMEHESRKQERMFTPTSKEERKSSPTEDTSKANQAEDSSRPPSAQEGATKKESHQNTPERGAESATPTHPEKQPSVISRTNSEGRVSPPKIDTACGPTKQVQSMNAVSNPGDGDSTYQTPVEPSTAAA